MSNTTSTPTPTATGQFQVENGQIVSPTGSVFIAEGINVPDSNMNDAAQILADFPGINFIRLNVYSYQSPSAYAAFIQTMSAAGVVVEVEDHTNSTGGDGGGGQGTAFTGTELTTELNWYSEMASAYASNPYVWFGTDNEPPTAGLSTWEQETYNAIRSTGNTNPIMIELPGGGYPGNTVSEYGMTESDYAAMTNIVIDAHFYGWDSNYSTNQATVDASLASLVQGAQTITSANGIVPVIIGEFGNSTNGNTIDANGTEVVTAVETSGYGSAAWSWDPGGPGDDLLNSNGSLTAYGQQVAAAIAAAAAAATPTPTPVATPTPTPTPTPTVTASANDTVVLAGSTAAITDANGNTWTIADGAVDENGKAAGYTADVTEIAYVAGVVWQENASDLWWAWNGTAWSASGTATSPLPATPTPTPSPTPTPTPVATPTPTPTPTPTVTASANDTVVLAGSTAAITDASGNTWTIADGAVDENGKAAGYTADVTEIAYVAGVVWQENASDLWWAWNGTAWSASGTATSPLPATPTPTPSPTPTPTPVATPTPTPTPTPTVTASANDTVVLAGSTAAITDASGNTWTIADGAVDENGKAAGYTADVTEIAYVAGVVWQENASDLWWAWNGTAWSASGTATSPLPATPTPTPSPTPTPTPVATPTPTPTPTPTVTASANDTVVLAGSTAAITDASGNTWTIADGAVDENGKAAGYTADVTEIAYVAGVVWQENTSDLWWAWNGTAWSASGTATSPLPATPTPTPSPTPTPTPVATPTPTPTPTPTVTASANDTVVLAGSTAAITDASGNTWTIADGAVDENGKAAGYTADVTEIAYVAGVVWQENTSDLWWAWNGTAWSASGTATSPLPATPTPTPSPTPTPTPVATPTPTPTPTPTVTASANDTVVLAGSTAAITDANGNTWTIADGAVDENGKAAGYTADVTEIAYVAGVVWQENASDLWWAWNGTAWSASGTATSPLPATPTPTPSPTPTPTPTVTASANDTVVLAGSTAAITDANGNTWTITSSGQVAVNGTAETNTANVTELAYVNGTVWQENTSDLWWGKTSPTAAWSPSAGTSTSPLPAPVTIAGSATSATVSQSEISVVATSGTRSVFISGSNDIVSLSGGTNTVTDTGSGNTYVLPTAGKGTLDFTSDILNTGDTLDLKTALAATKWSGTAATLSNYLTVTDSSKGAEVLIAATSGGAGVAIANIAGATSLNLTTLLAHSIT